MWLCNVKQCPNDHYPGFHLIACKCTISYIISYPVSPVFSVPRSKLRWDVNIDQWDHRILENWPITGQEMTIWSSLDRSQKNILVTQHKSSLLLKKRQIILESLSWTYGRHVFVYFHFNSCLGFMGMEQHYNNIFK